MKEILEKLKSILAYLIIVLAAVGIYAIYTYYLGKQDKPISFINSVTKENKLISSYAFVGVAFYNIESKEYNKNRDKYKGNPKNFTYDDWYFQIDKQDYETNEWISKYQAKDNYDNDTSDNKINGLCYKVYKVTYGYEDINKSLTDYKNKQNDVLPSIIGVETVQTKYAGTIDQYQCDSYDLKNNQKKRDQNIKNRLIIDGYYQYHLNNGCNTLNALNALGQTDINNTLAYQHCKLLAQEDTNQTTTSLTKYIESKYCVDRAPQETHNKNNKTDQEIKKFFPNQISNSYIGDIASLQISLSTLNLRTRGRWILEDHFYFRRDITEVHYGHSVYKTEVKNKLFSNYKMLDIYASPTQELYRNTYIANMHKNYTNDRKIDAVDMNEIVRESVNKILGEHKKIIYDQANKEFIKIMQGYAKNNGYKLGYIRYQNDY